MPSYLTKTQRLKHASKAKRKYQDLKAKDKLNSNHQWLYAYIGVAPIEVIYKCFNIRHEK